MEKEFEEALKNMLKRAAEASDSGDAMRFSQAAGNIVHAKHDYIQINILVKNQK